jgi:basic membrane lipoprotein Med (substrate-binding protein (PBP1-ABC) superfamily)/DNA-binding SARP family transcriptional activator
VECRILGPLEVAIDGSLLDLGPRKQRALFAYLLVNHGRTVSTDRILDALWGTDATGKENALWVYISRLRSLMSEATSDDVLVTRDHGYCLMVDDGDIDAVRFENLAHEGIDLLTVDPVGASERLAKSLELWRGGALEDFAYEEWAQPEIARLANLRRVALDDRIEADLGRGMSGPLIGELETQVMDRPYDETPVRQLILALYRSGRHTDALRTFERFRRRLADETGTDPSPELHSLEEQVLFHDPRVAHVRGVERVGDRAVNPYRGLEAFREDDAHLFHGRDRLLAGILRSLATNTTVTVIGPSGSGKSSAVRAGVIPALRKGSLPGSDEWLIATMVPGSLPFIELEASLLRARLDGPDSLAPQLNGQPDEILRAALRLAPSEDSTLLVVVDQFEELFTTASEADAERFMTAVVGASNDPRRRIRFLLTLRADFYDRPLRHASFGTTMSAGIVNLVPMAPEELEAAASGPARSSGVRLEPALEAALISDVLGEPGALPLFEFALTDLFDRRLGDTLTLDSYRQMGGIQGAVSRKADHILGRLTVDQQEATRQVFLRLVSLTDRETRSRRRVDASEILSLDLDVADVEIVLDTFGKERLLSFDRSDVTGSPTVEVAHEALLERWDRLSGWISDAAADLRMNARLAQLASEWRDHDRDRAYLLTAGRLAEFAAWAQASEISLARPERELLQASEGAVEDLRRAEDERLRRETSIARKAHRRAWGLVALATVSAMAAGYFVWNAWNPEPSVALVRSTTDDSGIAAMIKSGFDRASHDFGIDAKDVVVLADMEQRIRELAAQGTELIIGGLDLGDFVNRVAADYPESQFVILDYAFEATEPNITIAAFDDKGLSYLAGVAAASATRTGRVGILLGMQGTVVQEWAGAFEAGVASVSDDIVVDLAFVSSALEPSGAHAWRWDGFSNPDKAYREATRLYDLGADVILTVAGESGTGSIEAAADFSEEHGPKVWAIGVDYDEGFLADTTDAQYVLTSMIKNFDEAVYSIVSAFVEGRLEPTMRFGFLNRGVTYSTYGGNVDEISEVLDAVSTRLARGEVDLPSLIAIRPSWSSAPDDSIDVTFDGHSCSVSRAPNVAGGQTLNVEATNASSDPVIVGIGYVPTESQVGEVGVSDVIPGFSWLIPPGSTYPIRAEMVGHPLNGVIFGCFDDRGGFLATEVFPVAAG